jgi:tetratricopeptide (TPR) repeat protein
MPRTARWTALVATLSLVGAGCRAASAAPSSAAVQVLPEPVAYCDPTPVCPDERPPPAVTVARDWPRIEAILRGPEEAIDLAEVNLLVARARDHSVNVQHELLRLTFMTDAIRAKLPARCGDRCKIEHLNRYLFVEQGYAAEFDPSGLYNKIDRDLVHRILDTRMGYCEGLTYLYLSLGNRLGIPLAGVAARQHLYVRYVGREGPSFDIDTTLGGRPPVLTSRCEAHPGVYGESLRPRVMAARVLGMLGVASDVRSLSWLAEASRLAPGSPEIRHNHGLALARAGRIEAALDEFRAARTLDPCVPLFAVNEARQHWALGRRDEAQRMLDWTARRVERGLVAEGAFFVPLARASFAFEAGQDDRAEQFLREAVVQSDTAPVVLEAIASIRTLQGRTADALAAMRAAVRRDPTARTRAGLVLAYLASDAPGDAARQLARLEDDSNTPLGTTDLLRAMVAAARGATDDARLYATRCLREHGRGCAKALVVLGDVSRSRGEPRCARRYYEAFLSCPWRSRSRALERVEGEVRARLASLSPPRR